MLMARGTDGDLATSHPQFHPDLNPISKGNTMSRKALVATALAGCALTWTAGCASDSKPELTDEDATTALFHSMAGASEGTESLIYAEDLTDYLPGQEIIIDGADPAPVADGIVRGSVVDVQVTAAGRHAMNGDEEAPDDERVDVDAEDADWRELTATLTVAEAWGAAVRDRDEVRFIITISPDADPADYIQGLEAMDDALVILDSQGSVASNPESFRLAAQETALGEVHPDETIAFPATDQGREEFLGGIRTLDDLRREAYVKQRTIVVERFVVKSR
ncbi:hypothetical protein ASD66_09320 [Nocardioides sp. Root151]|nr:hypothetical protein ASD66_09320 [Nocardioides sp. Root151]